MIDVCYERLYGRLIGLMRMTRKSFVCACVHVCAYVCTCRNQTFLSCVSFYPVAVEARGLNDIAAEEGVTLS